VTEGFGKNRIMDDALNADLSLAAFADTATMDWQASPSPSVWRKRLDLFGGEQSRVTSVVRYDANSSFPEHGHPEGEEILVLDGVFSDEHGDYPAGTYLLNPPGFRHAPGSRKGCTLFVKLRQFGGERREHVVVATKEAKWQPGPVPGVDLLPLYQHGAHPEVMDLVHMSAEASLPRREYPGGVEVFVVEGGFKFDGRDHGSGAWMRLPPGDEFGARALKTCTFYRKCGHLKPATP